MKLKLHPSDKYDGFFMLTFEAGSNFQGLLVSTDLSYKINDILGQVLGVASRRIEPDMISKLLKMLEDQNDTQLKVLAEAKSAAVTDVTSHGAVLKDTIESHQSFHDIRTGRFADVPGGWISHMEYHVPPGCAELARREQDGKPILYDGLALSEFGVGWRKFREGEWDPLRTRPRMMLEDVAVDSFVVTLPPADNDEMRWSVEDYIDRDKAHRYGAANLTVDLNGEFHTGLSYLMGSGIMILVVEEINRRMPSLELAHPKWSDPTVSAKLAACQLWDRSPSYGSNPMSWIRDLSNEIAAIRDLEAVPV